MCGRLIFTWNAFRIECDPASAIAIVAPYDLRPTDLRAGAAYRVPDARAGAPLVRRAVGRDHVTFTALFDIDPSAVRHERAQADVDVASLSGTRLTLDAALRAHASEAIAGTITVTFDTDGAGVVVRRTEVTKLDTTERSGIVKTRTVTDSVERRRVARSNGGLI